MFVLRKSKIDGEVILWDASKGIAYAKGDERCPLDNIGSLVNQEVSQTHNTNSRLHQRQCQYLIQVLADRCSCIEYTCKYTKYRKTLLDVFRP